MICIADSEADIYEYLSAVPGAAQTGGPPRAHWIVRACQDGAVQATDAGHAGTHLWPACEQTPVLWSRALKVRGRQSKLAGDKRAPATT